MTKELGQKEGKISQKHQPMVDPYHPDASKPLLKDYDYIEEWQRDYDEWYRNQWGHCPNFAGHF